MLLWRRAAVLLVLLLAGFSSVAQERSLFSIVRERSKLEIAVYKEGWLKAFGHNHLIAAKDVSGQVEYDPRKIENSSMRLTVRAGSLTVVDPGISDDDRRKIQSTMTGADVLNAAKFPEIKFISTGVLGTRRIAGGWELTLSGKLNLHGVEKLIRIPIRLHTVGGELRAQGEASLLQTDYGITPVNGAGGTIKVKDKVKISFDVVAKKTN